MLPFLTNPSSFLTLPHIFLLLSALALIRMGGAGGRSLMGNHHGLEHRWPENQDLSSKANEVMGVLSCIKADLNKRRFSS